MPKVSAFRVVVVVEEEEEVLEDSNTKSSALFEYISEHFARSSMAAEIYLASSAAEQHGIAIPASAANCTVHFPVPFDPALSNTLFAKYESSSPSSSFFFKHLAVISIKNDSKSPLFHSFNAMDCFSLSKPNTSLNKTTDSAINCMSAYSMPLCTIFT